MITIQQLTNKIQNGLSGNGLTFNLFTDTGKFKRALRKFNTITDYINGIVSCTSSEITNTNDGLIVGTMTNRIEIIVRCKDFEEDLYQDGNKVAIGNETWIKQVRSVLDGYFSQAQFFNEADDDDNSFNVSVAFSFASTGMRNQVQHLGDSFSFVIYAYYNIVQAGENSRSYEVYLDGERVPYSAITPRRAPTHEQDTYNNSNGQAKATISNTIWGLSMECPSFISLFSKTIKNYIEKGERNVAHLLRLKLGEEESAHLVFFGECSITAQGVLNAGQYISFMEAITDYDAISFPESLYIYAFDGVKSFSWGKNAVVYNSLTETVDVAQNGSFGTDGETTCIVCDKEPTTPNLDRL